jgi:bifunctional oligoribonuclease and PAP phosphatase NrnA
LALQFDTFRTIIEANLRFVLTTHISPDGDGLGTEVALATYLKKQGKEVVILNNDPTPSNYRFLNEIHPIIHFDPTEHTSLLENAEVIVIVDTNSLNRLGQMKNKIMDSQAIKICIDHHPDPEQFADMYMLDDTATATAEIAYHFISFSTGRTIEREAAIALYTAIMTDTGSFRYPKTDPEVHKIVAHLIQMGADPVEIYGQVYEQGTFNRLQLLGMALANIQLAYNGKLSYLVITKEMLENTFTSEIDTDTFIPYTLTINGVQIGLMFSEMDGYIKISFRSKGDIWINELAKEFGGNGHKNAAGARLPHEKLDDIIPQVLEHAGAYIV